MSKRKPEGSSGLNPFNIIPKRRKTPVPPEDHASNAGSSAWFPSQQPIELTIQSAYQFESSQVSSPFETGKSVVKGVLAAIGDGSDLFLPLKAALVSIVEIMDVMDRVGDVQDDFLEMAQRLQALQTVFTTYQSQSQTELALPIRQRFEAITNSLNDLSTTIDNKTSRNKTRRAFESTGDIKDVQSLFRKVSSLVEVFQVDTTISIESQVSLILTRLSALEHQAAKVSQGISTGLQNLARGVQDVDRREIMAALDKLRRVPGSVYDAQRHKGCMEGTRVEVLNKLVNWSKNPDAPPIYWLYGMAGTGKTAIAWSFCDRLKAEELLGGSFFCSRTGSVERSDATRIIPTLAWLLAHKHSEFVLALKKQLDEDPDAVHKSVDVQVKNLLQAPLATLSDSKRPTLVLVIDALDECSDKDATLDMLDALIASAPALPVKIFVTSRPERHIRDTHLPNPEIRRILKLHEIRSAVIDADIRLYLEKSLEPWTSSYGVSSDVTFTSAEIKRLADLSKGLFIFASTAIKYIRGANPRERFETLTSITHKPSKLMTKSLDGMYELILKEALDSDNLEQNELDALKRLLATLLALRFPLCVKALACLLGQSPDQLRITLDRLHAVIHVPNSNEDGYLRTLHASFGDFLTTRADTLFRIDISDGDFALARACLNIMRSDVLHFNVSNSLSSCFPNPKPTQSSIPDHLSYACQQWPHHAKSASNSSFIAIEVETVFPPKFLFWLEALSALGHAHEASRLILTVLTGERLVKSISPHFIQFVRDASTFITCSIEVIEFSAPHIYLSALPCMLSDSRIFKMFSPQFTNIPVVRNQGIMRNLGATLRIRAGGGIGTVVLSADGTRIVSGSDKTIRVWDAQTGVEVLPPLTGHQDWVTSVALSADGTRIVSGSHDNTIRVWDAQTGVEVLPPLMGRRRLVRSVALSADGTRIVSGSDDKTIRVWDTSLCTPSEVLLARVRRDESGWLKEPSGGLVFWIPPEFRECIQAFPCILLLGQRCVTIDLEEYISSSYSTNWTRCYRRLPNLPNLADFYT